jgi:hypothetical protein
MIALCLAGCIVAGAMIRPALNWDRRQGCVVDWIQS